MKLTELKLDGFSHEQKVFALAKAALEIAEMIYKQEVADIDYENEPIEEICRKEIEAERLSGYNESLNFYHEAMDALFAWGEKKLLSLPECQGKEKDIKEVFQKVKRFPMFQEKLVEICMGLKA